MVVGPAEAGTEAQRADLGRAASAADLIFATADNPGDTSPSDLLEEFVPAEAQDRFILEVDRARAVERAIRTARTNDVVLLAGKGHRRTQEIAGAVGPFCDRAHAVEALALRGFGGDL